MKTCTGAVRIDRRIWVCILGGRENDSNIDNKLLEIRECEEGGNWLFSTFEGDDNSSGWRWVAGRDGSKLAFYAFAGVDCNFESKWAF